MRMKPTLFLDRDGTVNVEVDYLHEPAKVQLEATVAQAIALANAHGWLVIVVTNQSGIARGYYSAADLAAVNQRISALLKPYAAHIDAWYFCPHHPDFTGDCRCRKPHTGMFEQAQQQYAIDMTRSWMVGDKLSDVEAGVHAGLRSVLVRTGYGQTHQAQMSLDIPVVDSLLEAVQLAVSTDQYP